MDVLLILLAAFSGVAIGVGITLFVFSKTGRLKLALDKVNYYKGLRYRKTGRELSLKLPNGDVVDYYDYLFFREFYNQFCHTAQRDPIKWEAWTNRNSKEGFYTLFHPETLCPSEEFNKYLSDFHSQEHNRLDKYPDGFVRSLAHDILGDIREILWYPLFKHTYGYPEEFVKSWQIGIENKYKILTEVYKINGVTTPIPLTIMLPQPEK